MKTTSARKTAKAQEPYDDIKRPRKRTTKTPKPKERPSLPPASASLGLSSTPPRPAPGAVQYRKLCIEQIRKMYPGVEPRSDYDIERLSSTRFKGTPAEIYAALDKDLASNVQSHGYDYLMDCAKKLMDSYIEPTGMKPGDSVYLDNRGVFVRPIPDSKYSLRLFPGSLSAAEYCLDFVDSATGEPVNSPFDYELWAVPDPDAPWLSLPMTGKLRSIERGHGIKQKDILPGEEKFVLRDGQTCVLMRPGKRPARFTVPLRRVEATDVVEDVDVIDLPKVIDP
ncbi:hypothetical protein TRAPUB_3133 [Trametes pubescens]|uniref:Uncharacterized protein n=1 Tax=Trametes pubescens TaxID=154538 RepID=A0A1M2VEG8_TRAPU|nr:hypothetical protein TRAPUB_3133 [Trametes pubescens]